MIRFMQSKHLAVVAACFWASTLVARPATAQYPASVRIDGTFIIPQGETHTWTLTLRGLSYSHDDEIISSDPYDYYARSITRVYATSFDFQFQGPDADALNEIVSNGMVNQDEPFVELRNVTYYEPGWGALFQARDWIIAITPLDFQQGFRFSSIPGSLEYPPYTVDANGYPALEPFTSWDAWALFTAPGYAGPSGWQGGNTVSVSLPLPGDYNRDGAVDAADYVVWRKNGGTQQGYNSWRANFGTVSLGIGAGSGAAGYGHRDSGPGAFAEPLSAAVPEPSSIAALSALVLALSFRSRRLSVSK